MNYYLMRQRDGREVTGTRDGLLKAMRYGDTLIAHENDKLVVYEVQLRQATEFSPRNPFDLARQYKAEADRHKNQFWSHLLLEAAEVINVLANCNLQHITKHGKHPLKEWPTVDPLPTSVEVPRAPQKIKRRPLKG
jgi:hypothetical protein